MGLKLRAHMVLIDSLARLKVKASGPHVEWLYLSGILQDSFACLEVRYNGLLLIEHLYSICVAYAMARS